MNVDLSVYEIEILSKALLLMESDCDYDLSVSNLSGRFLEILNPLKDVSVGYRDLYYKDCDIDLSMINDKNILNIIQNEF